MLARVRVGCFFSSRRRHTRCSRDWSSDVCSSDLLPAEELAKLEAANTDRPAAQAFFGIQARNLARLNTAGARIVLGSDGNRPWGPHEEMQIGRASCRETGQGSGVAVGEQGRRVGG